MKSLKECLLNEVRITIHNAKVVKAQKKFKDLKPGDEIMIFAIGRPTASRSPKLIKIDKITKGRKEMRLPSITDYDKEPKARKGGLRLMQYGEGIVVVDPEASWLVSYDSSMKTAYFRLIADNFTGISKEEMNNRITEIMNVAKKTFDIWK